MIALNLLQISSQLCRLCRFEDERCVAIILANYLTEMVGLATVVLILLKCKQRNSALAKEGYDVGIK